VIIIPRWYMAKALLFLSLLLLALNCWSAPASDALTYWADSDERNNANIDHGEWQTVLSHNLVDQHPSGINRFDYSGISAADKQLLTSYLDHMQQLDPRAFNHSEQKAYWINLYNALTVNLIVTHYPVTSITKLGDSLFRFGPWDDKLVRINEQALSLNDIEHRILRPLFHDNRIHYAVNCASLGCPNLAKQAYTAEHLDRQLEQAAQDYVNHPRGVDVKDDVLWVSSIYTWYREDFGGNDKALIHHLVKYANAPLAERLARFQGKVKDHYDWALNQP